MRIKKIGVMCGARWYRASDWQRYPLFRIKKDEIGIPCGFAVGPILFWDGT